MEEIKRQLEKIFNEYSLNDQIVTTREIELIDRIMDIVDRETTAAFQRGYNSGQESTYIYGDAVDDKS